MYPPSKLIPQNQPESPQEKTTITVQSFPLIGLTTGEAGDGRNKKNQSHQVRVHSTIIAMVISMGARPYPGGVDAVGETLYL